MADQPADGNGRRNGGIVATLANLAGTLPGQFLALLVINVIFVGAVMLFVNRIIDRAIETREATDKREQEMQSQVIAPLLNSCIAGLAKSAPAAANTTQVVPVMPMTPRQ